MAKKKKRQNKPPSKKTIQQQQPAAETITEQIETAQAEPEPPWIKSWNGWYALVLGNLVFLIILFYIFTKAFE